MVCWTTVVRSGAVLVAMSFVLGGCGDGRDGAADPDGTAAPTGSSPPPSLSVVVVGDSIPYNSPADCAGCVGFVESYGEALGEELGEPVGTANLSRHDGARTRDIVVQLASGELDETLATADVVIMSVGFNDQPPYTDPDQPCHVDEPASDEDAVDAVVATTRDCVDTVTATLRRTLARGLRELRERAPGATVAALVPYDAWNGWAALDALPVAQGRSVTRLVSYALDAWRTALCAEMVEAGGVCVDVYRAFNGPDGAQPSGELLAPDYTHPSQEGNDRIRDVLLAARLLG
ncbi:MAG TPA: SGNH/GDSL hydrolase family protein [Nocardioides sp.]|nr:SGNH/GDSL hydrolase family protein [Nocardioides sp.]